jgi:hypothetical protein
MILWRYKKMHPILSIIILLEIAATLLIVYGFMNEEKFIEFEDRIIKKIFRK